MDITLYERPASMRPTVQQHFYHPQQQAFWQSEARFDACCAGRRSGKSVLARARTVKRALLAHETHPHVTAYKAIIGAPTRDQVKRLHWGPLKELVPRRLRLATLESELAIDLINGARVQCVGFDIPERAEGQALHDVVLDEIADMKEEAWTLSVRPSLGTLGEEGGCTFIGKPRGRNHWWQIWTDAAEKEEWGQFHWNSEDILAPKEIEALKEDLDPISYDQEVRANFVNFSGRAYYAFFRGTQDSLNLEYDPTRPLDFHFDFNVEPGTSGVSQEQDWKLPRHDFDPVWLNGEWVTPFIDNKYRFTAIIDEVYQKQNSNTLAVARELIRKWGTRHKGLVNIFGDASGGARKTSALTGSDWDIIKKEFRRVPGWKVRFHVPRTNPPERDRINAVNTRFMTTSGRVRCLIHEPACKYHIIDFEAVSLKEDGTGAIDKSEKWLTHPSDGFGYKMTRVAPVKSLALKGKQI